MRLLIRSASIAALVLLVAACGNGKSSSTTTTANNPLDPDKVSRLIPGRLHVMVEGDFSFEYDKRAKLRIVTIHEPDLTPLQFLSVGIHDFKPLPGDASFAIAFDLAGEYEGAGDYEIPATGERTTPTSLDPANPDPNQAVGGLSQVILNYFESTDGDPTKNPEAATGAHQFNKALQPCDLEVGKDARDGRLVCPEVSDGQDSVVSIEMEWDAT